MFEDIVEECVINEEYKIWKKNILFLYDLVMIYVFQWFSFIVQWFFEVIKLEGKDYVFYWLVLGIYMFDEQNYLVVV